MIPGCSRESPAPAPRLPSVAPSPQKNSASDSPVHLTCPPVTKSLIQQPSDASGHHQVLLTWNASAPSLEKVEGYCLYRSTIRGDARHAIDSKQPCQACERVNSIPVTDIKCVDDLVQDGWTYYYVAMAISSQRHLSIASNEAKTKIPHGKRKATQDWSGYARCRVPGNAD